MDISLIETQPFWEHLSLDDRQLLRDRTQQISFHAGQAIQSSERSCLGPIFVVKGIVRIYLLSEDGREATIYRLRSREACMLSASCILSAITFDVQIDAETDCTLLVVPADLFSALMTRNLYVENFVYHNTTQRLSELVQAIERMFFLTLRQRVAAFLIDESASCDQNELSFTQEQLARAIGSAREAVSRILKQLTQTGSISVSRGGIHILNKVLLYQELSSQQDK